MFRIKQDPSSGSLVQFLAKNYKNGSIMSVDMDNVGVIAGSIIREPCTVLGHDRIILVIFSQALYKAP